MSEDLFQKNSTVADESQEEISLEATLQAIQFSSRDTAFVVCRFTSAGSESFTATGEMIAPSIDDDYILNGRWTIHPKYGKQFRIDSYEILYPVTEVGIVQYLSSGLIRGIGPGIARRIVKKFGERTIDILNENIERLIEVEGIGEKSLAKIRTSWEEQRALQQVMLFLKSHGISTGYAVRIYRTYGSGAVERITKNPYALVEEVEGIGFIAADKIAQSIGIEGESSHRIEAGFLYVLREASRSEGHTYLTIQQLKETASSMLGIDEHLISDSLLSAASLGSIVIEGENVFLQELFYAEQSIAESLHRLSSEPKQSTENVVLLERVAEIERVSGKTFSPHQAEAILKSISSPVTIITGGPGTGKTTTVLGILTLAQDLQWNIALCAPTGRAAKRLSEIAGVEAKTIHRLLEFDPRSSVFLRNSDRPLETDIVIVDEMSMVDVSLMAWLVDAIPSHCRLVFVGDSDQLPSVGPGNVLRDLITSEAFDTIELQTIFRQDEDSSIVMNAHKVNNGEMPVFGKETFFIEHRNQEMIVQTITEIVSRRIPQELGYDPLTDIQVLSPMHQTVAGVRNLNQVLKSELNRNAAIVLRRGQKTWHIGDKVMQVTNNYDKDIYNGDIGFVLASDNEDEIATLQFDDRVVTYSFEELDQLVHAYAITIHKSQGSEYGVVVIPLSMQHRIMLQRNLLYTAMTRARRLLVFVGERNALLFAIKSMRNKNRNSALHNRITQLFLR